ncbi:hypothetical protein GOP47_0013019 [Adiantum capillus-veneris]|uniref:GDSL esterase/lipase n=1 Tax=Adiantum capillus-veneris TaxID=13818 RepID=A0A9D4URT6_ADICA|nr:hypothetical protein GOP47_0013019 [Adiantum capillus-veneris]
MAKVGCGLFVILAITRMSSCIEGAASSYSGLFVFGDSYVDTGNHEQNMASWRAPYGITWPGYPSGRFSDGLVFTDFYASFLNLTSPTPYRVIKSTLNSTSDEENVLQSSTATGINFGYGGSGVGPTFGANIPTINEQIKEIKQLIEEYVVSTEIVKSSIVLLVVAGNDYGAFLQNHSDLEIFTFIPTVVAKIGASLEDLYKLGFRTLAITNLEPIGCLPNVTSLNNYTACNETANIALSSTHNALLSISISSLQIRLWEANIIPLNLYKAFDVVVKGGDFSLRPCCEGLNGSSCGDVDNDGNLLYKVCSSPQQSLFWDSFHPTNAGWAAISKTLLSS